MPISQISAYVAQWNKTAQAVMILLEDADFCSTIRYPRKDGHIPYIINITGQPPAKLIIDYLSEVTRDFFPDNYSFIIQRISPIQAFDTLDVLSLGHTKIIHFELAGSKILVYLKIKEIKK